MRLMKDNIQSINKKQVVTLLKNWPLSGDNDVIDYAILIAYLDRPWKSYE